MCKTNLFGKIVFDKNSLFVGILLYALLTLAFISVSLLIFSAVFSLKTAVLLPYILVIPAVLFFIVRRISMSLWKMLILFSAISGLLLLTGFFRPVSETIYLFFFTLILAIISLSSRYKSTDSVTVSADQFGASMVVHGTVLAISGLTVYGKDILYFLLAHTLLSVCVFLLARQHYIFETAYGHIAHSPTQPSADVRSRHNRVILLFSLFSVIIVPVVVLFPYDRMADFLRRMIRFVFDVIAFIVEWLSRLHILPELSSEELVPIDFLQVSEEPSNSLLGKIVEVFLYVVSVIVVVLFLYFSIRGAYRFIVSMYRRSKGSAGSSDDGTVVDEVFAIRKNRRGSRRRRDFGEGEAREIRIKYYRYVRRAMRSGAVIRSSDSPKEIGEAVSGRVGKDFDALSRFYAKYRYGRGNSSTDRFETDD